LVTAAILAVPSGAAGPRCVLPHELFEKSFAGEQAKARGVGVRDVCGPMPVVGTGSTWWRAWTNRRPLTSRWCRGCPGRVEERVKNVREALHGVGESEEVGTPQNVRAVDTNMLDKEPIQPTNLNISLLPENAL